MLIWFLPAILVLGIITSYTDIKEDKVKNKHLIFALLYCLVAYSAILLTFSQINYGYIVEFLIMCLFSLITGVIIWYAGLWTAADAKLFFVYSALLPLSVYKYGYIHYFASINLLINTFIPMFIFLFIISMIRTGIRQKVSCIKSSLSLKMLSDLVVYLFALTWLIEQIFSFLNIKPSYFFSLFVVFLFLIIFEKLLSVKMFNILIIIGIIRLIFDRNIYALNFMYQFFMTWVIFIFIRFFALALGFDVFTKNVEIDLLRPGMVPAEIILQNKNRYEKQKALYSGMFALFQQKIDKKPLIEITAEGLTVSDIKTLKKLKQRLGFQSLAIQTTVPFAPFMFGGVLLTILFKGNMFFSSITLIQRILF